MSSLPQILITGLTIGALYSVATLGLSLTWASLRVLNLAHGALLAVGGYMAYTLTERLGLSGPLAFVGAMAFGAFLGWAMFWTLVRPMLDNPQFETNILIVTVGLGIVLENTVLQIFGGQPYGQPVAMKGWVEILSLRVPAQSITILVASVTLVLGVSALLNKTRIGLALRASAQNREAAALMGLPVTGLFSATMALSGALTAASGVMISSVTQLSPLLGSEPMLKAFIMCVLAGLGNVGGAVAAAFFLALVEVFAQYYFGARWGFPVLLLLVISILIWRPQGLFGRKLVARQ